MKYTINEITPHEMRCGVGACPSIYEAQSEEGLKVYLIIGKKINPSKVGLGELEKRIGLDEVLIEVSRVLIDNKGK